MSNIDRIGPTKRPDKKADGWQKWRDLLFVHWTIPVEALRPLIPARLEIDTYEGNAYIGLVPFMMNDVQPSWLPSMFAFNFLETNLRTYVHIDGKPGVYFFSLEAASILAVWTARKTFSLPYFHADMEMSKNGQLVEYRTTRTTGNHPTLTTKYTIGELLGASAPDTLEHFLFERYLLFTEHEKQIYMGQVYHTPYQVQRAVVHELEEQLIVAAGLPQPEGPPLLSHYSAGVDVEVFNLLKV
ncbi:MAG: hypothetical protein CL920_14585 [Deltaproteobacteria bacterium]|nr:hypothetical protein [Deltaproteobacteria bacterium]MBU49911.1 hypothetical protein [Deltaproteobacteria bacterium]|tara:strand:+ start:923 stop:1648 length:726 start_codon:yes stop_codon:yes gene_type:complete